MDDNKPVVECVENFKRETSHEGATEGAERHSESIGRPMYRRGGVLHCERERFAQTALLGLVPAMAGPKIRSRLRREDESSCHA